MEHNWNLQDLYLGFDDAFNQDKARLVALIEALTNETASLNQENPLKGIEAVLLIQEEMTKLVKGLFSFCSLSLATNVDNEEAKKEMSKLQMVLSTTTKADVNFDRFLLLVDIDALAKESQTIHDYTYLLKRKQASAKYLLSEQEEMLYSKLTMVASSSWSQLQGQLSSNLMVELELDGEQKSIPLSFARNLADHADAKVRKEAYHKELLAYEKIADSVAAAISNIKREVNIMNELRGYKSPLEPTLRTARIEEKTLNAMISSMKKYAPHFHAYLRKKAAYLGHANGLPFYDLYAPVGSLSKTYTYEEAQEVVLSSFYSFSDRMGDYAKKAFDQHWIDVEPKKGKRGGAFCNNLQQIKQSRIMTNFTGSLSDVSTLAHELGHGYHGEVISDERPLNWSYPMPLAETASILAETIVMQRLLGELDKDEEKVSILEISLQGSTAVIIDILSRYIFETDLFENTKESTLSKKRLCDMMLSAQKAAYGNGLDEKVLHPYMWLNKPHYYSAGLSFYNFPYAFGLLYGKGLYAMYLKDKEGFVKAYDAMLAKTGKQSAEDVALTMGIDVTSEAFWDASLEIIKGEIDTFISLTDKVM